MNTADSHASPRQFAGNSRTIALTTQFRYARWRASLVCGFCAFISANACVPIALSSCCDTAPTYWVRPVGEVVVAQAASASVTVRASTGFRMFMAATPSAVPVCNPRKLKEASTGAACRCGRRSPRCFVRKRWAKAHPGSSPGPALYVEVGDFERVVFDELAPRFDHVAHQRREDAVGGDCVLDPHLQQATR